MSIDDADKTQSELFNKLSDMNKSKILVKKRFFINNAELFLSGREKILNNFKSKIFPIKTLDKIPTPEPRANQTPEPTVFELKLPDNFVNKTEND